MKLIYITSVSIPAVNAQSVQILETSKALKNLFEVFELVIPGFGENRFRDESWITRINIRFSKGRPKYLEFCIKALLKGSKDKARIVYSRDILICLLFSFSSKLVIYEAHQEPSFWVKKIVSYLRNKNLYVVAISSALKNFYINHIKMEGKKIEIAHSGVDISKYISAKKKGY